MELEATRPALRARTPGITFDDTIPRHWLAENRMATHVANGINLLFPAGERFFVRSVRHYLDRIEDPALLAQVKGFFGQEGRHAQSHEEFFTVLESQGYEIRSFLARYNRLAYHGIERFSPPALRLAVTAASEHFTAILAEHALMERRLDLAHPSLRRLLMWHASEEIEHKAVAFDVLRAVNPSYALRMAGLVVASLCLGGFWFMATVSLLKQEGLGWRDMRREMREMQKIDPIASGVFSRGIREYVRRDFHPMQNDNYHLASEYLAEAGLA